MCDNTATALKGSRQSSARCSIVMSTLRLQRKSTVSPGLPVSSFVLAEWLDGVEVVESWCGVSVKRVSASFSANPC